MINVRITLENGNSWVTGFNGTKEDAYGYFFGKYWNPTGNEDVKSSKCIKVERNMGIYWVEI